MASPPRPHLLGIDDGPFEKFTGATTTPIVGVMMEGADLVEAVAITSFPVDGDDVTSFLAGWIEGLRFRPALQGVLFGGITIAGLAVLDARDLAARLELPVLVVNRREPRNHRVEGALRSAGFDSRIPLVARAPEPFAVDGRLHVAAAGASPDQAAALVRATRRKADLPEPVRLAHMIARALVTGQSRGRA